jgi:outer membrane immunogenic protein
MLASLRGRLGWTFDRALIYATGGFAYTQATFLSASPSSGTVNGDGKFRKWGSVFGGGTEWKQTPNFSWRGEALWYKFNSEKNFGSDCAGDHCWSNKFKSAWVIRGGMSYHFDGSSWGKGPIAARY